MYIKEIPRNTTNDTHVLKTGEVFKKIKIFILPYLYMFKGTHSPVVLGD